MACEISLKRTLAVIALSITMVVGFLLASLPGKSMSNRSPFVISSYPENGELVVINGDLQTIGLIVSDSGLGFSSRQQPCPPLEISLGKILANATLYINNTEIPNSQLYIIIPVESDSTPKYFCRRGILPLRWDLSLKPGVYQGEFIINRDDQVLTYKWKFEVALDN